MNPPPMVLLVIGYVPPLRDEHGQVYAPERLPCTKDPAAWDEDAEPETQAIAAAACSVCPALQPCRERAMQFDGLARGVWGGMIFDANQPEPQLYDATIAHLLVSSGTELRPARRTP